VVIVAVPSSHHQFVKDHDIDLLLKVPGPGMLGTRGSSKVPSNVRIHAVGRLLPLAWSALFGEPHGTGRLAGWLVALDECATLGGHALLKHGHLDHIV